MSMPITVPAEGDQISASTFGAPVATQLNTNTTDIAAMKALGHLASAVLITAQTGITAVVDIAGSVLTVTPKLNRRYRVLFQVGLYCAAQTVASVTLVQGSNQRQRSSYSFGGANASFTTASGLYVFTGDGTQSVFKLTCDSSAAANTNVANTQPGFIVIEDIGV